MNLGIDVLEHLCPIKSIDGTFWSFLVILYIQVLTETTPTLKYINIIGTACYNTCIIGPYSKEIGNESTGLCTRDEV